MKRFPMILLSVLLLLVFSLGGFASAAFAESPEASGEKEVKTLRILATSDLHGKFMPWDYALDEPNTSGSMTQLAAAIAEYRTDTTLLVDAGDTIQDNGADLFLDEDVHPMVQALNAIGYDVWVTGNHEYNYGMDVTRDTIADVQARTLVGNVYDENGDPLADGYTIFEKDGIRVAVIGMVTPCILRFDPVNLARCTVTDPLDETRRIIDAIQGQYDVLVGVYHMGFDNEYDTPNSGVTDILNACPEFDVMVSSHSHREIPAQYINNVLTVMNQNMAQTMAVIDLTLEKDGDGWRVADRSSRTVKIADYEPDPALTELLAPCDERARQDAKTVIGELVGGPLAPENEIADIPTAMIEDTALQDLINEVQLYYSGADVSMVPLLEKDANLQPGEIRKCDTSLIYKHPNTIYTLRMTGAQLRDYLEFNAKFYNTFRPGDLTISFNPHVRPYRYDMVEGVNYEINISREPGNRIENLTWPDGTPVKDDDEFTLALSNYRATSCLLMPGEVYEEDNLPVLLEIDVRSDLGGIREMIGDYIRNVKGGTITPDCDHNWRLTGYEWDEDLHALAVRLLAEGELSIPPAEDPRCYNTVSITVSDLPEEAVAACLARKAEASSGEKEVKTLRILATSDLHGKLMPWDYALDRPSTSGSMPQLAAAIAEYRTDTTLLVDAGDTIQDNSADLFLDEDVHPMVQALNAIGYDVWVTGNHEYNYGIDVTRDTIADIQGKALVGNVYDENGDPLADGCTILEKDGIRVAVIGMVTPSILHFDPTNLARCTVTDALEETRRIIDAIQGQYDVLVGVYHMGLNNEYDTPNSGVTDILNACPEFDVMVSSHSHREIPGQYINNVLTIQNRNMAQTMAVIDLTLEKDGDGWRVTDRSSRIVKIADYEPDPALTELLAPYDERARQEAETVIGELVGGPLVPENEIADIPTALIEDTALLDLINEVQLYYSGADVSMASIFGKDDNMQPGVIRKCDIAQIYREANTLYTLRMTGAQLRDYLEFNAEYYNTFRPGDLTISFNPTMRLYLNDMLDGINYEINIGREPGNRIENLTWPDGTPVKNEDEFTMALSNYRATACLLVPGMVYEEDNLPLLLDIDVRSDLGGVREMIVDYIRNVKNGKITPDCNHNWRLTGYEWDEDLHALAVRLLAEGKLSIPTTEDARCINPAPITVDDLPAEAIAASSAREAEAA